MAQNSPLLRPHRLPLFTRRLNEAAGAAEMNQSPAWAWEGRRTGRLPWRVGGKTSRMRPAYGGGVVMPCLQEKVEQQSCHPGAVPTPYVKPSDDTWVSSWERPR